MIRPVFKSSIGETREITVPLQSLKTVHRYHCITALRDHYSPLKQCRCSTVPILDMVSFQKFNLGNMYIYIYIYKYIYIPIHIYIYI